MTNQQTFFVGNIEPSAVVVGSPRGLVAFRALNPADAKEAVRLLNNKQSAPVPAKIQGNKEDRLKQIVRLYSDDATTASALLASLTNFIHEHYLDKFEVWKALGGNADSAWESIASSEVMDLAKGVNAEIEELESENDHLKSIINDNSTVEVKQ